MFIERTDVEAETPILCPPDVKSWLIWKYAEAGKDWRQEEKGTTEDEMVGWYHWLNGHEFGRTLGIGGGQGGLACCGSWGRKESDMTEWLNWTELKKQMKSEVFELLLDQFQGTCPQVAKAPWVQVLSQPLTSYIFLLDEVKVIIPACQHYWEKWWGDV